MAMYNLPADVKWPQQLGNVIRSFQIGQLAKQQKEQEQAKMLLAAMKEQRESQKSAAEIDRLNMLNKIMKKFVVGRQQPSQAESYGVQGGQIGPPEESADVLPGLELDRIGQRGPSFKVGGMGIKDIMAAGLGDGMTGYGKPSVRVGPRGNVAGMTYTPTEQYPEGYKEDLANAVSAISRGADPYQVYRRIASTYPKQSTELKRILLYTPATKRLDAIREALFGTE